MDISKALERGQGCFHQSKERNAIIPPELHVGRAASKQAKTY